MRTIKKLTFVCVLVVGLASMTQADMQLADKTNTAIKAGTLGIGLDISKMMNDKIAIRANINGLKYNRNEVLDDISYDADLKLMTVGVLADYYPMDNNFRISGGVYYNGNQLDATAVPAQSVTIGNTTYTPAQIGRLDTSVDFNKVVPYIGIGWGSKEDRKGWGFSLDAGVLYQGTANVTAKAVTTIPGLQTQLDQDVEIERKKIEDDMSDYKWYPVIMFGFNYTF